MSEKWEDHIQKRFHSFEEARTALQSDELVHLCGLVAQNTFWRYLDTGFTQVSAPCLKEMAAKTLDEDKHGFGLYVVDLLFVAEVERKTNHAA